MGCTVACVHTTKKSTLAFKTMDVPKDMRVAKHPFWVKRGKYKLLKFSGWSKKRKGFWSAINSKGVACLGLDANAVHDFRGKKFGWLKELMAGYEEAMSDAATAQEAVETFIRFNQKHKIGISDIVVFCDSKETIGVEYYLNQWGLFYSGPRPYVVYSNFFRVLRHLRPAYDDNSLNLSSARRFERANNLLSRTVRKTTVGDMLNMVKDHENGPSAFSICRHGGDGDFRTRAFVVYEITKTQANVHYLCNAFPCSKKHETISFKIK